MRELTFNESQQISGGLHVDELLFGAFTLTGAYLGARLSVEKTLESAVCNPEALNLGCAAELIEAGIKGSVGGMSCGIMLLALLASKLP